MLGLTSTESDGAGVGGSPTDVLEGGGCGLRVGMVGSEKDNAMYEDNDTADIIPSSTHK